MIQRLLAIINTCINDRTPANGGTGHNHGTGSERGKQRTALDAIYCKPQRYTRHTEGNATDERSTAFPLATRRSATKLSAAKNTDALPRKQPWHPPAAFG